MSILLDGKIPGLLNDARLWQHQVSGLSDMADASVADLTRADSISTLASAALAQAPTERFALAGLSMGGYVALEIMRQAPERVLGLALLNTTARPDTPQATEGRRNLMQLAETNFPAVIDTLLPKLVHSSRLNDDSIIKVITAMANSVGKEAFIRQQRAVIERIDSRPFLHQIKCPTLVLCGREDVITPIELHQEMVNGIPGSSLATIKECGHLSTLAQPQRVTEALRKWLLKVNDEQRTPASGLWRDAKAYLDAALAVQQPAQTSLDSLKQQFSKPAYFLVGHSIELSLKAFLRATGMSVHDLRMAYGHNLKSLVRGARRRKLGVVVELTKADIAAVLLLNQSYKPKELEYIVTGISRLLKNSIYDAR